MNAFYFILHLACLPSSPYTEEMRRVLQYASFILILGTIVIYYLYLQRDTKVNITAAADATSRQNTSTPTTTSPRYSCNDTYDLICGKQWSKADPTGEVTMDFRGEILTLRTLRQIVRKNPHWTSEQIEEELAAKIYTPRRTQHIRNVFEWLQRELQAFIASQPEGIFNPQEKSILLQRIQKTQLVLPPPASTYASTAELLTKNELYYIRLPDGSLQLRVGGAYLLNSTSWYNTIFSLGHELAHVIDPCEMQQIQMQPKTYENLVQCFVTSNWVAADKTTCGQEEQISETFADWIATQLVVKALKEHEAQYNKEQLLQSTVNAVRDLCEQSTGIDTLVLSYHPSPQIRIREIFGSHPKIYKNLECKPPQYKHCSLEKVNL